MFIPPTVVATSSRPRFGLLPSAHRVHRALPAITHASRARQGHADHKADPAAVSRTRCRHAGGRRLAPPLRSRSGVAVDRRAATSKPALTCTATYDRSSARLPRAPTAVGKVATSEVISAPDTERTLNYAKIYFAIALTRSTAIHSMLVVFTGLSFR